MATVTELFEFNIDGQFYRYTNKVLSTIFNGNTYSPAIVSRGALQITDNVLKNSLNVKLPRTNDFARLLLNNFPETIVLFTLYRNGLVYFQGQVLNASGSGLFIELEIASTYTKTTRPGITDKIQLTCRHVLYGTNCTVIKDTFGVAATISSVDSKGTGLTMVAISQPDNYFLNGELLYGTQRRSILKQVGTAIRISSGFNITPSGAVTLYPGCDRKESTCLGKFNNLVNFGGFSRLPLKDPHSSSGLL
jgi:hypothetical protein